MVARYRVILENRSGTCTLESAHEDREYAVKYAHKESAYRAGSEIIKSVVLYDALQNLIILEVEL
jgi:hypothetical protein